MRKIRRPHFKKDAKEFCFEALLGFCPVTGREFHIQRDFLKEHCFGHQTPANCFCSECLTFLYKERKRKVKRGTPVFFGKIV